MDNEHIIGALTRKRAEVLGQLEAAQASVRTLSLDLGHVDATLRMFNPAIDLGTIKARRKPGAAAYPDLTRSVMEAVRSAPGGITARGIMEAVARERGVTLDRPAEMDLLKRIGIALRNARMRRTLVSEPGEGLELVWRGA